MYTCTSCDYSEKLSEVTVKWFTSLYQKICQSSIIDSFALEVPACKQKLYKKNTLTFLLKAGIKMPVLKVSLLSEEKQHS